MTKEIRKNLLELGFNNNEAKIYIALTQLGEAPASQIAKKADLQRTTAISILNKLAIEGYLTLHHYRGVTYYWIESPKAISGVFETKIKIAEELNSLLVNIYRSENHFPGAQIFDTKTSIRNFIEKTISLMPKKGIIFTIDTPSEGNYSKIFSDKIENTILSKKKRGDIITKTLVPFGSIKNIKPQKISLQNIIIKELPRGVDFKASLWFIDNLVVLFSGNPPFIVAVKHPLIVAGLKTIYDYFWDLQ